MRDIYAIKRGNVQSVTLMIAVIMLNFGLQFTECKLGLRLLES